MNISLHINSLIENGKIDELEIYLNGLPKCSLSFKDALNVSYGLHRINRTTDAIKVLSSFEADEVTMIAIAHQRGIYKISIGVFSDAIIDFESVISIESKHNIYFCTPEAKFFNCICHIKIGSTKRFYLAGQLEEDTKVFYENKLWNKTDLIDFSHGITR